MQRNLWVIIPLLVSVVYSSCSENSPSGRGAGDLVLTVQKKPDDKAFTVSYCESVAEVENGIKKDCLCKALGFRVAQLIAEKWHDNVLRVYEIKNIQTGWYTPGIRELFSKVIGMDPEKITAGKNAATKVNLSLQDNWFIVSFADNSRMEIRPNTDIYTGRYLTLRAALQRGEKDLYLSEIMGERSKIEKKFRENHARTLFRVSR
jgi:hypothetical protein